VLIEPGMNAVTHQFRCNSNLGHIIKIGYTERCCKTDQLNKFENKAENRAAEQQPDVVVILAQSWCPGSVY